MGLTADFCVLDSVLFIVLKGYMVARIFPRGWLLSTTVFVSIVMFLSLHKVEISLISLWVTGDTCMVGIQRQLNQTKEDWPYYLIIHVSGMTLHLLLFYFIFRS